QECPFERQQSRDRLDELVPGPATIRPGTISPVAPASRCPRGGPGRGGPTLTPFQPREEGSQARLAGGRPGPDSGGAAAAVAPRRGRLEGGVLGRPTPIRPGAQGPLGQLR